MKRIEHIGIAVKDINKAIPIYEKMLATPCYKIEEVPSQGVITAFFKTGENKIELIASINPENTVSKFIEKRGEGVHHFAFLVEDIYKEIERLMSEGFVLINEKPVKGADNMIVAFLHPKSALGSLIELCQPNAGD